MKQKKRLIPLLMAMLIVSVGFGPLFSQTPVQQRPVQPNANDNGCIYLGTLAEGYPQSLIINEFNAANARIIGMKDNVIMFSINENTKQTTFFKNIPFLKEIHLDASTLHQNKTLSLHPLTARFKALHQKRAHDLKRETDKSNHLEKRAQSPSPNLTAIDRIIRAKAAQLQKEKALK